MFNDQHSHSISWQYLWLLKSLVPFFVCGRRRLKREWFIEWKDIQLHALLPSDCFYKTVSTYLFCHRVKMNQLIIVPHLMTTKISQTSVSCREHFCFHTSGLQQYKTLTATPSTIHPSFPFAHWLTIMAVYILILMRLRIWDLMLLLQMRDFRS